MKKILALTLACLMMFSLVACGNKDEKDPSENTGKIEVVTPTEDTTTTPDENETTNPTDVPVKEDEEYFVDLTQDIVAYDKNGIKVVFAGAEFSAGLFDEYSFTVTNNSDKDIVFSTSSIIINGYSFGCSTDFTATLAGEENTVVAQMFAKERKDICDDDTPIKCMEFVGFIVENPNGEYDNWGKVIESSFNIVVTQGQHDHRNHEVPVNGTIAYEDEQIAIYIDTNAESVAFADAFPFTVVNKTDKAIVFDMTTAEYKTTDITEFYQYTSVFDAQKYISPYGYVTGAFRLYNTKYHDITEMKLTIDCGEGNMLNIVSEEKFVGNYTCSGKVITIKTNAGKNN